MNMDKFLLDMHTDTVFNLELDTNMNTDNYPDPDIFETRVIMQGLIFNTISHEKKTSKWLFKCYKYIIINNNIIKYIIIYKG
jgi:hypothetical protein